MTMEDSVNVARTGTEVYGQVGREWGKSNLHV